MQAGDLADGPLADILRTLAAAQATGGLHVRRRDAGDSPADADAADAVLFLREGQLYAATAPGPRPLLGVRLVAAGAVTREALEEALESQAGELAGWRLGELLVHLGYVDAEIVAEFVVEQILDTVAEVSAWTAGGWRFRRGEKTREPDGLTLDIEDVLGQVHVRRMSWRDLEVTAGGASAVPIRVSFDPALAEAQIPLARTLLDEVDGRRTLAELATRCGLTTYEAGYVLSHLVESGAVVLQGAAAVPAVPDGPAAATATEPAAPVSAPAADDDLSDLFGGGADLGTQLAVLARQAEEARWAAEAREHAAIAARRRARDDVPAQRAAEPDDVLRPDPAPLERTTLDLAPYAPADPESAWGLEGAGLELPAATDGTAEATQPDPTTFDADPLGLAPLDVASLDLAPLDLAHLDLAHLDLEPLDLAPVDLAPVDLAPVDLAPVDLTPLGSLPIDSDAGADTGSDTGSGSGSGDDPVLVEPWTVEPIGLMPLPGELAPPVAELAAAPPADDDAAPTPGLEPLAPWPTLSPVPEPDEPPTRADDVDPMAAALAELRGLPAPAGPSEPTEAPPTTLPEHRVPGLSIGDPAEFVPTIPPADDRAAIHAALAEVAAGSLSAARNADLAESESEPEPAPAWLPEPPPSVDFTPASAELGPVADTASLLRELSFLGLDDAPPAAAPPAPRPPAPRPATATTTTKPRRKSIFGR